MSVAGFKFTALTGGGVGALDAQDGAALLNGDLAVVMMSGVLRFYELNATSGATESSPSIIQPDTNAGLKRWIQQSVPATNQIPVGGIIPFIGGYFTSGANAGFTNVRGNTAATINAIVNVDGWYVCNGAALNLSGSAIFNGSGRYLPNLSDSRFLMGTAAAGSIGGANTNDHTHTTGSFTLTNNEMPSHAHNVTLTGGNSPGAGNAVNNVTIGTTSAITITTSYVGGGAAHNHGPTGAASAAENRPLFLSCHYIMKAI